VARIKAFVSTCFRFESTMECISALAGFDQGMVDICVYDQTPPIGMVQKEELQDDAASLNAFLSAMLNSGIIYRLVMNGLHSQRATWSKNMAWAQFLAWVSMLPESEREYVAMIDNDVAPSRSWADECITALESDRARDAGISIISPYDETPWIGDDGKMISSRIGHVANLGGVQGWIRQCVTSKFWFMRGDFPLRQQPLDSNIDDIIPVVSPDGGSFVSAAVPTSRSVILNSREDRMPTDYWYWQRMRQAGNRFAVLYDPPAQNTTPHARSARAIMSGINGRKEDQNA